VAGEPKREDESAVRLRRCFERIAALSFVAEGGHDAWRVLTGEMRNDDELRRKAMRVIVEAARLTEAEREVLWASLDLNDDHRTLLKYVKDARYLDEGNGLT
jgi:hypothetical protein